ncbi:hypothetical protein OIV83_001280 [Microbotryomycetes sp. JL201]|nr:hypothetical protein OIV83_001280 [Microbotryomycetes sp. JL201]
MSSASSSVASSFSSTSSTSSYTSLADLLMADGLPVTWHWDSLDFGDDEGSDDIPIITTKNEIIFVPPQNYLPAHEDSPDQFNKGSCLSVPSTNLSSSSPSFTTDWVNFQKLHRRQVSEFGEELQEKPRLGPINKDEGLWPITVEAERKKQELADKSWKRWFKW